MYCLSVSLAAPTSGRRRRHRHHHTALDRVTVGSRVSGVWCVVVWCGATPLGDACVPGFGCGLARESVGGVGFVRLVCEVLVSVSCVPLVCVPARPPVSLNITAV